MNSLEEFESLFSMSPEEQIEHDASMLAFQFLSKIDEAIERDNISKKELALKVGTSASFITQLFRGDRKPSWKLLAKMQKELNIDFKVTTSEDIQEIIHYEINEYHRKWSKKYSRTNFSSEDEDYERLLYKVSENDYALAG